MSFLARVGLVSIVTLLSPVTGLEARAADATARWEIVSDGGISWDVTPEDRHEDFIEMGGQQIALVIRYGVDKQGDFVVSHSAVWPMLRFQPNITDTHLLVRFGKDANFDEDGRFSPGVLPAMYMHVDDNWLPLRNRTLKSVYLKGVARFEGTIGGRDKVPKLSFRRSIFPSADKPVAIDTMELTNVSGADLELSIDAAQQTIETNAERGVYGGYVATKRVVGGGVRRLRHGESTTVTTVFEARKHSEAPPSVDFTVEESARLNRVAAISDKLRLDTPDAVLNTAFSFAKVRTAESIFLTRGGLMHAPGGGSRYYAAIWANDQAEYANPFFGMLGDPIAAESAINSFRHFARFMNPDYRPIPSSIVGEGANFWNGAGDRGDMAMIAYGAARFALAYGNKKTAEGLWPLIEWCLEYLRRKVNEQGVVASDSDELEGRFPAGRANLSTSSLYYDALRSAAMLGRDLGKSPEQIRDYDARSIAIRTALERYFGATVDGFETYRYYDKSDLADSPTPEVAKLAVSPDVLRAWIAIPLTMDILDRKGGTIAALFSPQLWTADGVATAAGRVTYWDRSTLYALRGVLAAGAVSQGMEHLKLYSERRLLGDHVPYPFEAYPEGGKAQLAGESALYCRVFTEGLFGMRPTGLRSFTVTPRLPDGWPTMALTNVHAFGSVFDLRVKRTGTKRLVVSVTRPGKPQLSYTIDSGATATIKLTG